MKPVKVKFWISSIVLVLGYQASAQYQIKGTVNDENAEPLPGATILLLNTSKWALSDADGSFVIKDVEGGTYFAEISYLGFLTSQQKIEVDRNVEIDFEISTTQEQLEEVVVSVNRRLEDIQKTASAVSAIQSKQVEQLQIKQFGELNSIAPNFRSYDDGGTGSFSIIASRGISTIDLVPTIGLYVDDVPYFTTLAYPLALSDVEQIEILRGPQGTLYGRNALAGVIKITTKRPSNKLGGFATAGFGNLDSHEFGIGLNAPILDNKFLLRTNVNYTNRDGFVRNNFNDKDLQNRETLDGNFKLKYFANDRFSLSLIYGLQHRESLAYAFAIATPDNSFQDILANTPNQANINEDVFRKSTTHNVALNATYDFDKFNLTAVTAYQYTDQSRVDDFDLTPLIIQSAESEFDFRNISQEIRLASNGQRAFEWTTGIFAYKTQNETDDILFSGADNIQDPFAPNQRNDETERKQEGIAVFGQTSYNLTNKLKLTGGLRFDYEEASASVTQVSSVPGLPVNSFDESADFTALSPKLSLGYQAKTDVFLFVNIARGFRPGGINTFVTNPADAPYDPENTINYEAGLKSNFMNNRIKFNVTGFYIRYSDQQVFTVLDVGTFNFGTDNVGKSRSLGLEIESQWVATKGLTFSTNLGYLNTEILDYISSGIDFNTGAEIQNDESGNDLPVSPEFNGNLNANYILPINDRFNLETSVDYIYQTEIFWNVQNDITQDAYGLLNAKIGVTSKNMDVFFWGKNLTDIAYFSYGYGVGGFSGASFGLPQTYGFTVTGKF
ncbi:MAG: TonB-dependent receptor [Bacteroidota bacterium]